MPIDLIPQSPDWPKHITETCPVETSTYVVGIAQNTKNQFIYCERFNKVNDKNTDVEYFYQKTVFATKKLIDNGNPFAPTVKQVDLRSGELRESSSENSFINLRYQKNAKDKIENVALRQEDVDAVDAGFNNYITTHWNHLTTGNTLSLHFGSMVHLQSLPLRISEKDTSKCASNHEDIDSRTTHCFVVEIDSALLRLLVGNIKLSYDSQRRLIKFDGIVNIESDKQKNQSAIIDYYYASDYIVNTEK
jgi:hypothetical protein